jgi:glutamyl-tRNA reductase
MAILALGISHRGATVELLERLAFTDDDYAKAYRLAVDDEALEETVILSTCNRVEVYASVPAYHAGFQSLRRLLCECRDVAAEELAEPLYSHFEDDAVEHLFSVAAGLDSMVLGEQQILSQVREALRRAEEESATDHGLTGLFHAASRAGRRVRTETGVGAAPDAFVEAGADLAAQVLGGLEGKHAVVVGAGQMSALAVKHLRARGVGLVRILNRSIERARTLAERTASAFGDLEELEQALAAADLVVSATGAAGILIHREAVAAAMGERERPLFLVDIEGLRVTLAALGADAHEDIARAHAIVEEEVRRFTVRRHADRLAPLIRELRERGDGVLHAEMDRHRSDLADLTPDERAAVEALARGIVAKLLHDPIVRLKELSAPGSGDAHAKLLAELFGIELPSE